MGGKGVAAQWGEGKRKMVGGGNGRRVKRIKEWDKKRGERRFTGDMEDKGK